MEGGGVHFHGVEPEPQSPIKTRCLEYRATIYFQPPLSSRVFPLPTHCTPYNYNHHINGPTNTNQLATHHPSTPPATRIRGVTWVPHCRVVYLEAHVAKKHLILFVSVIDTSLELVMRARYTCVLHNLWSSSRSILLTGEFPANWVSLLSRAIGHTHWRCLLY